MEVDFHSLHCDNCINFVHCKKIRRKGSEEEKIIYCPIIPCQYNCGHQFHECKRDEHELLCLKFPRVPCINQEFGCPMLMQRGDRGKHLKTCPASVIVCTMEWNRWPLGPGKNRSFDMNIEHLDVAATLRDQKTVADFKKNVPSTLRHLLKTSLNDRHPVMGLGVAGSRIPRSILNQNIIEQNLKLEADNNSESEQDESFSDSPWGSRKCPPGLQESVCTKLKTLNISQEVTIANDESVQNGFQNPDDISTGANQQNVPNEANRHPENNNVLKEDKSCENGCAANNKKNVELSLMLEVRTRCQKKPDAMYTFMCSREFRRDEFPEHFSHIHSSIASQLNGWLFMRCPMSYLGCSFGCERMNPVDENYCIVYNPTADAFCFTQKMDKNVAKINDKTDTVSLSSLPFELLVNLTKYLDPLSLNSLSMTNRLFRDACSYVVISRGIVVLQWEKKPEGGWEVVEKKWIFSSSFSPIKKWVFGDVSRIITHMKTCPFFERNVPEKPFAYPVAQNQL